MALGGTYNVGTVTILVGTPTTVTGTGTLWSPVIEEGDWLFIAGQTGIIASVNSDVSLTLETPWITPFPSGASYVILKNSWLRYDPAITQAKVRELLLELDALTPATATVNALARFAVADGKSLKNSTATLSDAGVLTLSGSAYPAGWLQSNASGVISSFPAGLIQERASNTMLAVADKGRYIAATAQFTQTFDTAANLGNGWWCRFENLHATAIMLLQAPASSFFVPGGQTTFRVYPGEDLLITCSGSHLFIAGANGRVLLRSQTAANVSILDFPDVGPNAPRFRSFEFELDGILPTSDGANLSSRPSIDNGASYLATGIPHVRHVGQVGQSTAASAGSNSDTQAILVAGQGNSAQFFANGFVRLAGVNGPHLTWKIGSLIAATQYVVTDGYARFASATNAVRFFYNTGNIASGTIRCYGLV